MMRVLSPMKAYMPLIPFLQRLQRKKLDKQFAKFVEIFKKLHIIIPFADAIVQIPSYSKFLKEILSNKRKLEEHEIVCLNEESFGLGEAKPTTISLQLADRLIKRSKGIIEDLLGRALIDVYDGKMILQVDNEQVIFNVFKAMKHPLTFDTCCQIDVLEELVADTFKTEHYTIGSNKCRKS
ncbi:uncharacterized protein LOC111390182 [Olea europaea var. sylvestris]|uniref:uncharacterized protein LOC111390182 n=1 Tax=Olea europaea var. sylvestris TaxID=158386 RepID=UPI000C1CD49E|nr:uncharacterized protein LOC111390182 [Olea europaea var. sylvestris]